jgi:hypothetical protein
VRLEDAYRAALDSPQAFEHRAVLWVGSESYCASAICVLQGLHRLGFTVYTIGKPNINSWWCNVVVNDPNEVNFDLVLSGLHWGTRWSHYDRFGLHDRTKVLIDGDDVLDEAGQTWREKHTFWRERYGIYHGDKDAADLFERRWVEPLGDYVPDVVFTMQKQPGDTETCYLPAGLHDQYWGMAEPWREVSERHIDVAHIPGPGVWRSAMQDLLSLEVLAATVHRVPVRGEAVLPDEIRQLAAMDEDNVHSWHRWACWTAFYNTLNYSKILIHPGIDHLPFWECKRPYEGWACGCVVAMAQPCTDVSDYPPTEVCPEAVYSSHDELFELIRRWLAEPDCLENLRRKSVERAYHYFCPEAVARYFLHKIREVQGG